jgi:hypothetical protein
MRAAVEPKSTFRVETTLSFARNPVISEVEILQSPKPSGRKTGAMTLAITASMDFWESRHHGQMEIKGFQEPDDDGCQKDDGKCPLKKVLCLLPQQLGDIFRAGQPVVRKLHDKGDSLSLEYRILGNPRHQNADQNAQCVEADHDNLPCVFREKGGDKEAVNRIFCGAAHKRSQHDRHFPVTLRGKRARSHNARHGASEADQHGHNGSSGKADSPEKLVHDKGNPCHIAGILQQREEEEQRYNNRQEGQDGAHPGKNAVNNQRVQDGIDIRGSQRLVA